MTFSCMWLARLQLTKWWHKSHHRCIQGKDIFALFQLYEIFHCFSIRSMCNTFFQPTSVELTFYSFANFFLQWWSPHAVWCFNWTFISCINLQRPFHTLLTAVFLSLSMEKSIWKLNSFQLQLQWIPFGREKLFYYKLVSDCNTIIQSWTWQKVSELSNQSFFSYEFPIWV